MKKQIPGDFSKAVENYIQAINEQLESETGVTINFHPYKEKIIRLYKQAQPENRIYLQNFIFKKMLGERNLPGKELKDWLCDKALELIKEFEKI